MESKSGSPGSEKEKQEEEAEKEEVWKMEREKKKERESRSSGSSNSVGPDANESENFYRREEESSMRVIRYLPGTNEPIIPKIIPF